MAFALFFVFSYFTGLLTFAVLKVEGGNRNRNFAWEGLGFFLGGGGIGGLELLEGGGWGFFRTLSR